MTDSNLKKNRSTQAKTEENMDITVISPTMKTPSFLYFSHEKILNFEYTLSQVRDIDHID